MSECTLHVHMYTATSWKCTHDLWTNILCCVAIYEWHCVFTTLQTLSETYNQCVHIHSYPDEGAVPSLVPRPSLPPVVEPERAWVQDWYIHLLLSCVPDRVWERDRDSGNETTPVQPRFVQRKFIQKSVQRNLVEFHLKQMSVPYGNTAHLEQIKYRSMGI